MAKYILIVDDDPVQRRLLSGMVEKMGYSPLLAEGGAEAIEHLSGKYVERISLIFLDLIMPEIDGMAVLAAMSERQINIPTIAQTAQGGIETAVEAMRAGAFDFVVKPISPDRVRIAIAKALKVGASQIKHKRSSKAIPGTLTFDDIISSSPNMAKVKHFSEKSAQSNIPVLIEGESGVGKELIARAIQGASSRKANNFVTVNCGALPENLVESILFGHEKGAFTGASEKQIGKFGEADGGTLFLDEVGELPLEVQVKLLRAIQEGEIDPVGARKSVKVDIRLISATNRKLADEVKAGKFREDLYYRLNVFPVTVPPLRERREDIPDLARHFVKRISEQENRAKTLLISPEALELLEAFDWPGNIRQLENAIFRAVVLCEGDTLTLEEFPQIQAQLSQFEPISPAAPLPEVKAPNLAPDLSDTTKPITQPQSHSDKEAISLLDENGEIRDLEAIERDVIAFALELHGGQMSRIARQLGIGRSTLYRKLKEHGLDDAEPGATKQSG